MKDEYKFGNITFNMRRFKQSFNPKFVLLDIIEILYNHVIPIVSFSLGVLSGNYWFFIGLLPIFFEIRLIDL
jgi:hypothetical protein